MYVERSRRQMVNVQSNICKRRYQGQLPHPLCDSMPVSPFHHISLMDDCYGLSGAEVRGKSNRLQESWECIAPTLHIETPLIVMRITCFHPLWMALTQNGRHRVGLWDSVAHCGRSERKTGSASKKEISPPPTPVLLKYSSGPVMMCWVVTAGPTLSDT